MKKFRCAFCLVKLSLIACWHCQPILSCFACVFKLPNESTSLVEKFSSTLEKLEILHWDSLTEVSRHIQMMNLFIQVRQCLTWIPCQQKQGYSCHLLTYLAWQWGQVVTPDYFDFTRWMVILQQNEPLHTVSGETRIRRKSTIGISQSE